jgi:hypothetical protein
MHTQHLFFPLPEMVHQHHQDLLKEAEHVRLMRQLKPQRNRLARRLAQAASRMAVLAHFRLPVRDLETA